MIAQPQPPEHLIHIGRRVEWHRQTATMNRHIVATGVFIGWRWEVFDTAEPTRHIARGWRFFPTRALRAGWDACTQPRRTHALVA